MAVNDRAGALRTFCALLPLDDPAAVREALAAWPAGAASPFARLPSTHFARFVVLDGLRRDVAGQPPADDVGPYLLFSAFFDGEPVAWLTAVCERMGDEAHGVWRHCRGCPGPPASQGASVRAWLEAHRVPATAVFGAYPDATVAQVREALAFRARFRAFAWDQEARRTGRAAFRAFAEGEA